MTDLGESQVDAAEKLARRAFGHLIDYEYEEALALAQEALAIASKEEKVCYSVGVLEVLEWSSPEEAQTYAREHAEEIFETGTQMDIRRLQGVLSRLKKVL